MKIDSRKILYSKGINDCKEKRDKIIDSQPCDTIEQNERSGFELDNGTSGVSANTFYYPQADKPKEEAKEDWVENKIDGVKMAIHHILQKEIADKVWYQDKGCEIQLKNGLDNSEKEIAKYFTQQKEAIEKEWREKIKNVKYDYPKSENQKEHERNEIKFRAWNKVWGMMSMVDKIEFDNGVPVSVSVTIQASDYDHKGEWEDYEIGKDIILQQFTGLKDKNGKEIYEGDIVLGRFILDDVEDYIYLSLTDMERKNQSKTFLIEDISYLYTNPIPEDIEVIGNVFENPELLNKII